LIEGGDVISILCMKDSVRDGIHAETEEVKYLEGHYKDPVAD
jgi:hypothetical protein